MNDMMVIPEILDRSVVTNAFQSPVNMPKPGSVPREALWFGWAHDGLPMLLNMDDPIPGSILAVGDADGYILRTIADGIIATHSPGDVTFGVLSNRPGWNYSSHCVGAFRFVDGGTSALLSSLVIWAGKDRKNNQHVILLIDDLSNFNYMKFNDQENLRWLFFQGPKKRIWPICTIANVNHLSIPHAFRTRLYNSGGREFVILEGLEHVSFSV